MCLRMCQTGHPRRGPASEVPGLGRRRFPFVVAPVDIHHGSIGQFGGIDVIEGAQVDGIEGAGAVFHVCLSEGAHPAGPAEAVMDAPGAELVVRQFGFADSRRTSFGLTAASHDLCFAHTEQLHLIVPALRSRSASKRTLPQWQLPLYVFFIGRSPERFGCGSRRKLRVLMSTG